MMMSISNCEKTYYFHLSIITKIILISFDYINLNISTILIIINLFYFMRLLIYYEGVMKIYPTVTNLKNIIQFVTDNYSNLPSSDWELNYIDSDGDMVTLSSEADVITML
eukprot:GHVR01171700.1.p1 GENE.GHVR01171700.1~~GHVR01171700.1.p1  ORF type:complete len:110 (+),score=1.92 GHVR01171700.1:3658-3987(+)